MNISSYIFFLPKMSKLICKLRLYFSILKRNPDHFSVEETEIFGNKQSVDWLKYASISIHLVYILTESVANSLVNLVLDNYRLLPI